MSTSAKLDQITDFPSLIHYLRDELEWEIPDDALFNELTFSWTPSEVGLELNEPIEITQLRPLRADQPWGIFFLNFPHAKLPVTVMRRILRGLSKRQRASANAGDKAAWDKDDLLFISAVGEANDRRLSFAHFQDRGKDLPALRVIGWDHDDTVRRLSHVDQLLHEKLAWPGRGVLAEAWRDQWRSAFTERPRESVRTARAMAEALAALARDIRDRIRLILPKEKPDGDLRKLFEAVKQTLSKDLDTDKFADTYAQTIAYGLLSARINQVRERDAKHERAQQEQLGPKPALPQITADAAGKAMPTTNPFLRELFGSFLSAGGRDGDGSGLDFDELGVSEVVDLLNAADMEAVLLDFDKQKAGDDPVIHFYEGFLHAYDKALKVQRGVFYTPRPVVSFIVRSVDEVLRTEFGLEDGLADTTTWAEFIASHPEATIPDGVKGDEPFVKILDPATGTGTFLVEVIELIHDQLVAKWKNAGLNEKARLEAWNAWVPQHLLPRLYGFELMMAPYAVAHMKIGLKLADTGYRFEGLDAEGKPARARVFLTNALEPARRFSLDLNWSDALAHEADAANAAKEQHFTVVVGNPPYSGHSSNPSKTSTGSPTFAGTLIARYFTFKGEPLGEKQPKWLQDDYVKFFGLAEHLARRNHCVVGLVTNHGFIDNPTFRGMREQLLGTFGRLRVLDLGGNAKKGLAAGDQNVFDIEQGVAVTVGWTSAESGLEFAELRGSRSQKGSYLSGALTYREVVPAYPFLLLNRKPSLLDMEWSRFLSLSDGSIASALGVVAGREDVAIDFDRHAIVRRLSDFANASITNDELKIKYDIRDAGGFVLSKRRPSILGRSVDEFIHRVVIRPWDDRWIAYSRAILTADQRKVVGNLLAQGNIALVTTKTVETERGFGHAFAVDGICTHHCVSMKEANYVFPLWLVGAGTEVRDRPNLSLVITARLAALTDLTFDDGSNAPAQASLGTPFDPPPLAQGALPLRRERGNLKTTFGARDVFDWIYAVLHSPAYRKRYADFLKSDFARIPLPKDRALFADLIPLGTELVALHLLDPVTAPILADPKVRFVNPANVEARLDGRKITTRRNAAGRVYLNDGCWFETVPESVWNHWIGGYEPAQKWLKDRAQTGSGARLKTGRVLTPDDQLHYRRMIVALARTAELMVEIDQVVAKHGGWPDAFRGIVDG
jgi:hypothetical protein